MTFPLPFSAKFWVLVGISTAGLAFLVYDHRRRAEEQIMEFELSLLKSADVDTQKNAIKSVLEHISKNKSLLALLCSNQECNSLKLVKSLITSSDPDTQFAAVELVALMSEEEKNLDKIREAGLFQAMVTVLSSPVTISDEITESILIAIRNCTKPTMRTFLNPATGRLERMTVDQIIPRDRNDNMYDRDDEWFSRELYQLHGLEPVVIKLLSEDEDIQLLALEIITNYCKMWKNKEEVGELGGVGFISKMLMPTSNTEVQSLALNALRYCIRSCECNTAQLRKAKPVCGILSFLQSMSSGAGQIVQSDIYNGIYLLSMVVDNEGAAHIRENNLIPQLVEYAQSSNKELAHVTNKLLRQITMLDSGCKKEFASCARGGSGNTGITPRRTTR